MLIRHSLFTATASNWVYTMNLPAFAAWLSMLAERSTLDCSDDVACVIRIARQYYRHDALTERQWCNLQSAYNAAL